VSAACGCTPRFRREAHQTLYGNITEKGEALVEGDMVFTKQDAMLFAGLRASEEPRRRWKAGEVFYELSRMPEDTKGLIRQSLNALSRATGNCVRFTELSRQETGRPLVSVYQGNGCNSMIGRMSNGQFLSLGWGCLVEHTIQHEFMHALGFYHEQSRKDRDDHVVVHWDRIDSNMCHNFQRCAGCALTTPYDIRSIMHYHGEAFNCGGRSGETMVAKSGVKITWNQQLTQHDIAKIKTYYQCTNGPSPVA